MTDLGEPWIPEMPAWWDKGDLAWTELMLALWHAAGEKLKHDPEHQKRMRLAARMGRKCAEDLTRLALEVMREGES